MMTSDELFNLPVHNQWGDGMLIKEARKYWMVVTFDWWSVEPWFSNTVYAYVDGGDFEHGLEHADCGYEMWDKAMVFDSYREAHDEARRRSVDGHEWFPINMADDERRDKAVPGDYLHLMEFAASRRAFTAKEANRVSRLPSPS